MSIDTDALKASVDIVAVVGARIELKKVGKDYVGLCPFHSDRSPSFNVVPDKNFCTCMSCKWTGDVIKFVAEFDQVDFKEAAARLGAIQSVTPRLPEPKKPDRRTYPPPPMTPAPDMKHPTATWLYRTPDGDPWFYIARYNMAKKDNGKFEKRFVPYTWGDDGWQAKHPSVPRPLYNLDVLHLHPDARVMWVEGEKCARAGQELMPDRVVVASPGGANAISKCDFSPLRGRVVMIWPDPDAAGSEALKALLDALQPIAAEVWVYNVSDMTDDLADLVDQDWSYARIREWETDQVQGAPRLYRHVYPAPEKPLVIEKPTPQQEYAKQDMEATASNWKVKPYKDKMKLGGEDNDKLIKCVTNRTVPFRHDDAWKGVLRWDQMAQRIVCSRAPPWGEVVEEWKDFHDVKAAEWLDTMGLHYSPSEAGESIETVAHENEFHPVQEYLATVQEKWDGVPRIDTWLSKYMGAKDSKFVRFAGAKWLIAAARRARRPGVFVKNALVLISKQDQGKSSALDILGGRWFGVMNALTGDNMKAKEQTSKLWIIENAEMAATKKSDADVLKDFISTREDTYRPAYGRRVMTIPRCCVFAFTVNHEEVFTDETGNVRFWPVGVGSVDLDALRRDRDQLWAEAALRETSGENHYITEDDVEVKREAAAEQENRMVSDAWHSVVKAWVNAPERAYREWFKLEEILRDALNIDTVRWDRAVQTRVGSILRKLGFEKKTREAGKVWLRAVDSGGQVFDD